jgi:3'(2'), 5'-bisphosphate nucleotidase
LQGDVGKVLREKVFSLTNGVLAEDQKLTEEQVKKKVERNPLDREIKHDYIIDL